MATIREMIRQANAEGFIGDNAEARVCQDIVLMALFQRAHSAGMRPLRAALY